MDKKPCPFPSCNTPDPFVIRDPDMHWVRCANPLCSAEGPIRDTEDEAITAWNLAIRAPTDPKAVCKHLTWCPVCNPSLEGRR